MLFHNTPSSGSDAKQKGYRNSNIFATFVLLID